MDKIQIGLASLWYHEEAQESGKALSQAIMYKGGRRG